MVKKVKTKSTHPKETIQLYWEQVKKYKVSFVMMAVAIPLSSILLDTIVPYFLSMAVGSLGAGDSYRLQQTLILAACIAAVGIALNMLGHKSAIWHESAVRGEIAQSALAKLLAKDQGFFTNQKIGALNGKFIDYINGHVELQDLIIIRITTFVFNLVLGLVLIALHTPTLAIVIALLLITIFTMIRISRSLRENIRAERKHLIAEINGAAADIITNNTTVKTFAQENYELERFKILNDAYRRAYLRDFRWMTNEAAGRLSLMHITQIISIFLIAGALVAGKIDLSIAIFTVAYLQRLATQLFVLGELIFGYDKVMLSTAPMTEILVEPSLITDRSNTALKIIYGKVDLTNVDYAYRDDKNTSVLKNFDLTIPAGQKIGLVGHSGAGKTTLTRLLLRFDDIDSGEISIDGQDIAKVTQHSLRQSISYVPQEPMLFHRNLRDNISYGNIGASEDDIINATKQANAWEFINKLPGGLDTIVGERGIKLSGGQRQRIAIARVLLKNAPILILDEATSALDSESEALIQQSLNTLMSDRTSIVVAHRLSTLRHMDRIIVMDGGKIIEDGTHQELLTEDGMYAKLWKRQSGGFIEE